MVHLPKDPISCSFSKHQLPVEHLKSHLPQSDGWRGIQVLSCTTNNHHVKWGMCQGVVNWRLLPRRPKEQYKLPLGYLNNIHYYVNLMPVGLGYIFVKVKFSCNGLGYNGI